MQLRIYQVAHLSDEVPDLPLRSGAEAFVRHMDQFSEITGQIQRCGTGIGEDVPGIFVGYTQILIVIIPTLYVFHILIEGAIAQGRGYYILETIFRAVPLATLSEAAMAVTHQLMGTGSGNTFNLEGEVDMLKYAMMATCVQMLDQGHSVLGVAVIADRCDLGDGLYRVRGGLNQSDFHISSPL
jgi:hypothetical protein